LIVLEALASGTPIVATAVGGIGEVLTGALAANLVPPDDPGAIAERVRSLHGWRTRMPELGLLGRRHVEANYTVNQMGNRLNEAIAHVEASLGAAPLKFRTGAPSIA
jgi:glycosyltransferase involved in cell wall biosynthesis